jgi:hypothetical protein
MDRGFWLDPQSRKQLLVVRDIRIAGGEHNSSAVKDRIRTGQKHLWVDFSSHPIKLPKSSLLAILLADLQSMRSASSCQTAVGASTATQPAEPRGDPLPQMDRQKETALALSACPSAVASQAGVVSTWRREWAAGAFKVPVLKVPGCPWWNPACASAAMLLAPLALLEVITIDLV